jgi:sigma-B regulation protein RsbU (phosphoserine phosphatase)
MIGKLIKALIVVLGVLLIAYPSLEYAREATKLFTLSRSGQMWSDYTGAGVDSLIIVSRVDTRDFAGPACPSSGDTLVAAVDSAGVTQAAGEWLRIPRPPGSRIRMIFARRMSGDAVSATSDSATGAAASGDRATAARDTTTLVLSPVDAGSMWVIGAVDVLRVLIHIGYLLVGFWAFTRRPDSPGVRVLTLFSFSMAALMTIGVRTVPDPYAAFTIPGARIIQTVLSSLVVCFGVLWLNLSLLFPQPVRWLTRHPVRFHLLIYAAPVALSILEAAGVAVPGALQVLLLIGSVSAGFIVLGVRRGRTRDPLERRQLTLVSYGTGIGMSALLLLVLLGLLPGIAAKLSGVTRALMATFAFLALLLSPASFAYAFGRYRILEVEGRLRRGTRFALVTVAVLAVFLGGLFALSELFLKILRVESRTPALAVAMASALGFVPVLRRTQGLVERRFYPERLKLRALLADLLSSTSAMPDRRVLWEQLEQRLQEGLGAERLIPLLAVEGEEILHQPDGAGSVFTRASGVVQEMARTGSGIMVDEARASGRTLLTTDEDAWLAGNRVSLLLPMSVRGQLVGLLALTLRADHEDLRGEELSLLVSVAAQIGLQSENLRLLEENIQKRHFEEQLATARRVQERFLPSDLPPTPGLEIAARCIFSLEVAGDYYDVIRLDERRTLLAIGDVSGKGAGAAMIMANVQASLRALSGADIDLARAVARLNEVIRGNTELGQFITFFACIYDSASGRLEYVNAGHNPPRIVRATGEIVLLETGGPILGVLPEIRYEQGTVDLSRGDLFVAFTDGVTEAFDAAGEEFGESHVAELLAGASDRAVGDLVDLVQQEVTRHTGSESFADDFTIVVARIRGEVGRDVMRPGPA